MTEYYHDSTFKTRLERAVENAQARMGIESMTNPVKHPLHYNCHPSGVECITITKHMNFCLGNAIKYIWRAGLKADNPIQDLEKAREYIGIEIERLKGAEQ